MVGGLDLLKVFQLSWQFQSTLVGVHDSLFLEINALLNENSSHGNKILIRAEMLILNFLIVVTEIVFWASDDTKVRRGLL